MACKPRLLLSSRTGSSISLPKRMCRPRGAIQTATLTTNILGQLHVILAMQQHVPEARLLVVSSSNVYGMVEEKDLPVSETAPLRPADPYAVSKVGQEMLALQYWQSHGLPIVRVRPFNHIGPRQAPDYVIARFARELAQMEAGLAPADLDSG